MMIRRLVVTVLACTAWPAIAGTASAPTPVLSRSDFNLRAQERMVPLFWRSDDNRNGVLDPEELAVLWGPWAQTREDFVDAKGFRQKFRSTYEALAAPPNESGLAEPERRRRAVVRQELAQGQPTLVETDLRGVSPEERRFFELMKQAAHLIERLYARQVGSFGLMEKIAPDDVSSQALFHRNQSPFCVAPKTEREPNCGAFPVPPKRVVGLYPASLQENPAFCSLLQKAKNSKALMNHFTVVTADGGKQQLSSVPYTEVWKDDMEAVARTLTEAAQSLESANEKALQSYLLAAALAFRTNDWEPANRAWVAMGATNSRWYLRVGPDEVYYEPCAWKAGFALQLARINPASLDWQKKLEPVKGEMEAALAALAGRPYRARRVDFKLPDFIDVALNAGDQRNPHGATIGQSLPNWGPVSESGGRTVVMTNLYTDIDSQETLSSQMQSLFCKSTFALATTSSAPALMSVVLHESAHNLGPSHDYKVNGKTDDVIFGGPLAATMEELKAQSSALYLSWWLAEKGVISEQEATQATVRDVAWAFGHIARGLYDAERRPKSYSQLASIQLGMASESGALLWKASEAAANGTDTGCFELDFKKWRPSVNAMVKRVLEAKSKGDRRDAEKMKAQWVDGGGTWAESRAVITERWLRAPKATFVYSLRY